MPSLRAIVALLVCLSLGSAVSDLDTDFDDPSNKNPIAKVMKLLNNMEEKLVGEGQKADKDRDENIAYCREMKDDLGYEIKTGNTGVETLTASIAQTTAQIEQLTSKVDSLQKHVAEVQKNLDKATALRKNESDTFLGEEKEALASIDVLSRAIGVLEKELSKGPVVAVPENFTRALSFIVEASAFTGFATTHLDSLIQSSAVSRASSDDTSEEDRKMELMEKGNAAGQPNQPSVKAYESKSGSIVETLEALMDKGNKQLQASRQADKNNDNNYKLLRQSFEDDLKASNRELADVQDRNGQAQTDLLEKQGEFDRVKKTLAEDNKQLNDLIQDCTKKAEDYATQKDDRTQEVAALHEAQRVLNETTSAAISKTYQPGGALLQVSSIRLAQAVKVEDKELDATANEFEVVRSLRALAKSQDVDQPVLTQLADRVSSAMRASVLTGADPFAKVKGMLSDMLAKLKQQDADGSSKKAYCDKETSITNQKIAKNEKELNKLTGRVDADTAKAAQDEEDARSMEEELNKLQKYMADATEIRNNESAYFQETEPELALGVEGVQKAINALRAYYDKAGAAKDAGKAIIGMIEVAESDFAKNLADLRSSEKSAKAIYDKEKKEGNLRAVGLQSDIKYKLKESADLKRRVTEVSTDRSSVQLEHDALSEYLAKLADECTVKAEPYAETVRRREADMKGIKDALQILGAEAPEAPAAFLQAGQGLRDVRGHVQI